MKKQNSLLAQKQGNSASLAGVGNTSALQQILSNQAQQMNTMGASDQGRAQVNAEKGNKNSFYLKQQLQQNRSKDRASGSKKASAGRISGDNDGHQLQHRKNNSVVINRGDVLRVDGRPQRHMEASPDRVGQSSKALKLPGMQASTTRRPATTRRNSATSRHQTT